MPASVQDYVPQCVSDAEGVKGALLAWFAVSSVALLFLGLIFLAPLLLARGHVFPSGILYKSFGLVCHQIPQRAFHLEGHPLAVCARCFGLYAGFAAGALIYPLTGPLARRHIPARAWLVAAALPTTVDFALGFTGLWENTHLSRSLTGALLGAAAAFYVVPGLADLYLTIRGNLSQNFRLKKASPRDAPRLIKQGGG